MTGQIISEAEVDRSVWKVLILGVLTIAASIVAIYGFNHFLVGFQSRFFLLGLVGAIFLLIMAILNVFFIKSFVKIITIGVFAAGIPLVLFYPGIDIVLIAGAVLFFLFLMEASRRGHGAINNSLKMKFFLTAGSVLPKAVTGFLLFLAVIFFTHYYSVEGKKFNENINWAMVNQTVNASAPAINFFLPGFSADSSTDEILGLFVGKQVRSLVPDFERYMPEVQQRIFNEVFSSFKDNLQRTVGSVDGKKTLAENLYVFLAGRYLNNFSDMNKLIFAAVFTFLIFLVAKGATFLFNWLIEFLAFVCFKILIIVKFAYISLENRSREFVALT